MSARSVELRTEAEAVAVAKVAVVVVGALGDVGVVVGAPGTVGIVVGATGTVDVGAPVVVGAPGAVDVGELTTVVDTTTLVGPVGTVDVPVIDVVLPTLLTDETVLEPVAAVVVIAAHEPVELIAKPRPHDVQLVALQFKQLAPYVEHDMQVLVAVNP